MSEPEGPTIKRRDIMTTDVLTVHPDLSIRDVAEILATNHFVFPRAARGFTT